MEIFSHLVKILSKLNAIDFVNAFLGAFAAILLSWAYNFFIKKILYWKLWGNYYHGNDKENNVVIRHFFGEKFTIYEYKLEANKKVVQWKGSYTHEGKGLLSGIFDYNYSKGSTKADWGKHHLHLLPNNKKISVLSESIVPKNGESKSLEWIKK